VAEGVVGQTSSCEGFGRGRRVGDVNNCRIRRESEPGGGRGSPDGPRTRQCPGSTPHRDCSRDGVVGVEPRNCYVLAIRVECAGPHEKSGIVGTGNRQIVRQCVDTSGSIDTEVVTDRDAVRCDCVRRSASADEPIPTSRPRHPGSELQAPVNRRPGFHRAQRWVPRAGKREISAHPCHVGRDSPPRHKSVRDYHVILRQRHPGSPAVR